MLVGGEVLRTRLAACDQKDKSAHTLVSDNRQYAGHWERDKENML